MSPPENGYVLSLPESLQEVLLISEAIRYGDCHTETMDMASYWLLEKQLVHKLFKVLVPRFESSSLSYTKMYRAQKPYPGSTREKSILELRGNPYPDLAVNLLNNRNLLHNVLLDAAKVEYRQRKYAEMAEDMIKADVTETIKIANLTISEQQTNEQAEVKADKPEAETAKHT